MLSRKSELVWGGSQNKNPKGLIELAWQYADFFHAAPCDRMVTFSCSAGMVESYGLIAACHTLENDVRTTFPTAMMQFLITGVLFHIQMASNIGTVVHTIMRTEIMGFRYAGE